MHHSYLPGDRNNVKLEVVNSVVLIYIHTYIYNIYIDIDIDILNS